MYVHGKIQTQSKNSTSFQAGSSQNKAWKLLKGYGHQLAAKSVYKRRPVRKHSRTSLGFERLSIEVYQRTACGAYYHHEGVKTITYGQITGKNLKNTTVVLWSTHSLYNHHVCFTIVNYNKNTMLRHLLLLYTCQHLNLQ